MANKLISGSCFKEFKGREEEYIPFYLIVTGEMAEWSKAPVLKTGKGL